MKKTQWVKVALLGLAALWSTSCGSRTIRPAIAIAPSNAPGFDASALGAALTATDSGNANIHSIVIERHGKIIAELYRSGSDRTMMKRYGMAQRLFKSGLVQTGSLVRVFVHRSNGLTLPADPVSPVINNGQSPSSRRFRRAQASKSAILK